MGSRRASGAADITVASVQSIISGDRINKFDSTKYKLVMVDEAHHIAATSYMRILAHFGLLRNQLTTQDHEIQPSGHSGLLQDDVSTFPPKHSSHEELIVSDSTVLVGVSATFSRSDGVRLSDAIDNIVYHKDFIDMITENWLTNVLFTTVQSKADISRVKKTSGGDFHVGGLSKAVNTPESNEITVRAWLSRAAERKSTLIFCVDLAHVSDLTATFRRHGVDARFVTGDTAKKIRSERLDAFRKGDFPVLINCGVFTEGTDIPNIDCVMLARPTRSRNLLIQMIGRGMRLHPGKENCHVIDMIASLEVGIVTTPTLLGLDPAAMVNETTIEEQKSERERQDLEAEREEHLAEPALESRPSPLRPQSITFTDYDSVYDLIDDASGEKHVRGISLLAWVRVRQDRYVLSTHSGDYLSIETVDPSADFKVIYMKSIRQSRSAPESKVKKSPYMRPREIAQAKSLLDAVRAADTFALKIFPRPFVLHNQAWRRAPATEGQLAFINKLRPMEDQLTTDMISKGKAGDMINKIKFGAKGWFEKMGAEKKREGRAKEELRRVSTIRQHEQIKVGPLVGG
jgi:ATP-dependent helicase IRC3